MRGVASIGLKGETEFLRRYNNRTLNRKKKIKTIKFKGIHLFFVIVLLFFIGFSALKASQFILSWEKLNVKSFKLVNSSKIEFKNLKKILKNYNGNILMVNFTDLRKELLKFKIVKDVSLTRVLPSTIMIKFLLREPIFQFKSKGEYNIIDRNGIVLYRKSEKQNGLITIKDLKKEEFEKIYSYLHELTEIRDLVDYISFVKPYGVKLKLKRINEIFYPGEKDYIKKINYFLRLKKIIPLKKNKIKYVDLRFKDRIYFEYDEEVIN